MRIVDQKYLETELFIVNGYFAAHLEDLVVVA